MKAKRQLEDAGAGAAVLRQRVPRGRRSVGSREVLREPVDVVHARAPPPVDTLVIVAADADILAFLRDHVCDLILQMVGVLIFVDENIFESILIICQHVFVFSQQRQCVKEKIVKIHRIVIFEFFLIQSVDFPDCFITEIVLID